MENDQLFSPNLVYNELKSLSEGKYIVLLCNEGERATNSTIKRNG